MKALLFGVAWVGVGAVLATRRRGAGAAELLLMVAFWPLFLGGGADAPASVDPMDRLRRTLGPGDVAEGLLRDLGAALLRLAERQERVEGALRELATADLRGPAGEARAASRVMLQSALDRVRIERQSAIAAVEEAATRLLLAREEGERGEVEALLMALRARLVAGEEVEASVRKKAS